MNRVKEVREANKLSQRAFAKLFNVSQGTVSGWENGRYDISNDDIQKIANYFGVSIDYLLGYDKPGSNPKRDALDKALELLSQMEGNQRQIALALLQALVEQNKK